MKVYILQRSVDYESTDILGIFANLDKAILVRDENMKECEGYSHLSGCITHKFEGINPNFWSIKKGELCYCVTEHEVIE